ncbi:helix-turn-helix domain-containing protein [Paenibacillus agaridevorans]|uniref:helix-turn-helix domain-containing protein n=1 Tax=Paenibacillus agaridevorans TaxID=171404 RepID=UPI001BE4D268|nr:helix-turn-helix domain-containing protein [Paenibacillus agaridevorans]
MIKERDEELLWDTVSLLSEQNLMDNAKAVFKSIVERTFVLLKQSTDFLDDSNIEVPSKELSNQFRYIERQIRYELMMKDYESAHEQLVEYIELLSQLIHDDDATDKTTLQKRIMAKLLSNHFLDAEGNEYIGVLAAGKTEVYSSTEVAEILGVSDQTIRRWCDKRKYPDAYQTEGGHWRIPKKYFKITIEEARKRKEFEEQLNTLNNEKGEADEDEFL